MSTFKNIRIGEVLMDYGYVTASQIEEALAYQSRNKGKRLGAILIELEMISEEQMLKALATRLNLEQIEVSSATVDLRAVAEVPHLMAAKYNMLPISRTDHSLVIVTNDPLNFYGLEDIHQTTGKELEIKLCERAQVESGINYYYSEVTAKSAATKADRAIAPLQEELVDIALEEEGDETPVIKLLNTLIQRAYTTTASDIHIEPYENETLVRMRIDGTIVDFVTIQKANHTSLVTRIKILSDLDIAERRIPQDGHFRTRIEGQYVNIRVSVIPTVFGEKVVLRLLAGNAVIQNVNSFGMIESDFAKFSKLLKSPNGMIYITGPTGSGKTTTLYMILEELVKTQVNISTIEDPVEKNLLRTNQMQVNNTAGLTFESGLRALLRQDPDVIMVGETRDAETASISVRAAITGHLVLSTLHTNDSVSSILRLIDMGMEPYMIASALVGVVAQRLMRLVCPHCRRQVEVSSEEAVLLPDNIHIVSKAVGCNRCNNTGYTGRIAIHEILSIDAEIRKMVTRGVPIDEIASYAYTHQGLRTLKEQGVELVRAGRTTIEELLKVAYYA
jgi:type IV pilus assembly protein PilB